MPVTETTDHRVLRAATHPLRMQLLTILNQRVASPKELADETGESLAVVSYHMRALNELKCIELVRTEPRRGAVEHYYRALERPIIADEEWEALPASVRRSLMQGVLKQIGRDVTSAAAQGGFDGDRAHLSRTPLVFDQEGWAEYSKLLEALVEAGFRIQAESVGRIQTDDDAESLTGTAVLMLFETGAKAQRGSAKPPKRKPAAKAKSAGRGGAKRR